MTGQQLQQHMIYEALQELDRARRKFPVQDVWVTLAALTEEVGELNQAILQFHHEPHKGVTLDAIHKEARQVIVMALRVVLDTGLDTGDAGVWDEVDAADAAARQAWNAKHGIKEGPAK